MTKYSEVREISSQAFLIAFTMLIITISSDLSTWSFGQLDVQVNQPPTITIMSPIEGEINQAVVINASISDPDGNITSIIWNQEDESGPVKMNISQDKQSMSFIPTKNVTYVFSVEGIDNNGSATLESVQVNIGP
jgi:K319L-like, PKD domain